MDSTASNLLRLCDDYARATNRAGSTISRLATGSGQTFFRLRAGCSITTRRAARAFQWFSDHWPADLPWPADILRPAPNPDRDAA